MRGTGHPGEDRGPDRSLQGRDPCLRGLDYAFQITAIDGTRTVSGKERDQFRIRIWDRLTGEVVYDNRRGEDPNGDAATVIDGGRITIKD